MVFTYKRYKRRLSPITLNINGCTLASAPGSLLPHYHLIITKRTGTICFLAKRAAHEVRWLFGFTLYLFLIKKRYRVYQFLVIALIRKTLLGVLLTA